YCRPVQHAIGRFLSVYAATNAATRIATHRRLDVAGASDRNHDDVLPGGTDRAMAAEMGPRCWRCCLRGALCFLRAEPPALGPDRCDAARIVLHSLLHHRANIR